MQRLKAYIIRGCIIDTQICTLKWPHILYSIIFLTFPDNPVNHLSILLPALQGQFGELISSTYTHQHTDTKMSTLEKRNKKCQYSVSWFKTVCTKIIAPFLERINYIIVGNGRPGSFYTVHGHDEIYSTYTFEGIYSTVHTYFYHTTVSDACLGW